MGSFDFTTNKISKWKSKGIFNRSSNSKYHASSNRTLLEILVETYIIYKMMVQ